ncbi:MAG: nucleoside-diphosphate kinase [Patescibacteria group bacterium]
MKEKSLVLVKPDAFERKLESEIYKAIRLRELKIVARKKIWLNERMIRSYQPVLNEPSEFGEDWKREAIEAMVSGSVEVLVVEGDNALKKTNEIKKKIRSLYSPGSHYRTRVIFNLIHTTDNLMEFQNNIKVLIPEAMWL